MQVNIDLLDNPEAAQDILQQLDIAGAKTAYAYLVGFDGTMCIILPLRKSGSR